MLALMLALAELYSTLILLQTALASDVKFSPKTGDNIAEIENTEEVRIVKNLMPFSENLLGTSAKTEKVVGIIREEAENYGVDPELAVFLAKVESGLNPTATTSLSSATGLFQFISGTWRDNCEGERTDPRDNTRCAMRLIADGQLNHWTVATTTHQKLQENGFIK